ncbi:zinc finger protein ZAT11-like [Prosopis cineraria]|uniref:zinc finger protein ZAT11-like n=1 Tax=Prosopis cineraria TaxID=364024 RepID=UPI00240FF70B|nr:zinc finger protein ZAT11-like [Prosopis cineraria]
MEHVAVVKEQRADQSSFEDMAKCLMMLSHVQDNNNIMKKPRSGEVSCVEYECKTCKRKFSSFQALGGHRASHKRPRLEGDQDLRAQAKSLRLATSRPKIHECSICGLEFSLGQALGGHMRRHRFAALKDVVVSDNDPGFSSKVPVLKRSNSKRVQFLDLNLTPLENDLKLLFGTVAPKVEALI